MNSSTILLAFWNVAWQSTVILSLGMFVSRALRTKPAQAHLFLCLAMAAALLTPCATEAVRRLGLGVLRPAAPSAADASLNRAALPSGSSPVVLNDSGLDTSTTRSAVEPSFVAASESPAHAKQTEPREFFVVESRPPEALHAAQAEPLAHRVAWAVWFPWLLVVAWCLATGCCLARIVRGWRAARRLIEGTQDCDLAAVQDAVRYACARFSISASTIFVGSSSRIRCPLIWAWGRTSKLIVPHGMGGDWSASTWQAVVCHELAHLVRRDHWTTLGAELVAALLPWQPLAWWAKRALEQHGEQACDAWAVNAGAAPLDLAELLIQLTPQCQPTLTLAVLRRRSALSARVAHLVQTRKFYPYAGRRWGAAVFAATLTAVLGMSVLQRGGSRAVAQLAPVSTETQSSPSTDQGNPAAEFEVVAESSGRGRVEISAEKASLTAAGQLEIETFDDATGDPLSDVEIECYTSLPVKRTSLKTDQQGKATWLLEESPRRTRLIIETSLSGYVPIHIEIWDNQTLFKRPHRLRLYLAKGVSIGGVVVDNAGQPVQGAKVQVLMPPLWCTERNVIANQGKTVSDANGHWTMNSVPGSSWPLMRFWVQRKDYYPIREAPLREELLASSLRSVLVPRLTVSGVIRGHNGQPIAGAGIIVNDGSYDSNDQTAASDAEGRFRCGAERPGDVYLIVKAKDHALYLKQMTESEAQQPLEIQLEMGRTLTGQVVDVNGNPVAGAMLWSDSWRGMRSPDVRLYTNQDGRFTWNSAPEDAITFRAGKLGYVEHMEPLVAGTPVKIVLGRPMAISGQVSDAATGQAIQKYVIVPGWRRAGTSEVHWRRYNSVTVEGERFQYRFNDPVQGSCLLRIEAPGYVPAVSPELNADQTAAEATWNVRLERGTGLRGSVRQADGAPAEGAKVYLTTKQRRPMLTHGTVIQEEGQMFAATDPDGVFQFDPAEDTTGLVAVSPQGIAMMSLADFQASGTLILARWATIKGTVFKGRQPWPDQGVRCDPMSETFGFIEFCFFDNKTTTDANGAYVFEFVPPGQGSVSQEIRVNNPGSMTSTGTSSTKYKVDAGEAIDIRLGGGGRPVVGLLTAPAEAQGAAEIGRRSFVQLWNTDEPVMTRFYSGLVEPDGAFRVENMLPGEYNLRFGYTRPTDGSDCGPGDRIAIVEHQFMVPAIETLDGILDEPLDLGELQATMLVNLQPGDVAPDFTVTTLDGNAFRLSDQRGKVVLVDFWATWCGPCIAEMPFVKRLYEALADNDKFVLIGLSRDENAESARAAIKDLGMTWENAHLDSRHDSVAANFGVRSLPARFLIGPDGRVIARELRGAQLEPQVRQAIERAAGN